MTKISVGGSIGSLRGSLALDSFLSSSSTCFRCLGLPALLSSSRVCCLSCLSLSALLGRGCGGSLGSLSLATLLCGGCSALGCLALPSLLRGGGCCCSSLGSLSLSALLGSSVASLVSGRGAAPCDSIDVDAGSFQGSNIVLVSRGYYGLDSFLEVRARVGRTGCCVTLSAMRL